MVSKSSLPMLFNNSGNTEYSERDLLYKVLFEMKKDLTDLKKIVVDIINSDGNLNNDIINNNSQTLKKLYQDVQTSDNNETTSIQLHQPIIKQKEIVQMPPIEIEDSLSLEDKELELIKKALQKHNGRRKNAAKELGISERTLYRKINEHSIK